jgi:hypothetical protein
MIFGLIIGFGIGVFVGYKYPVQVEKTWDGSKKLFNELKNKMFKKSPPGPTS